MVSQHTPSTQKFDAHWPESVQSDPLACGVGVSVGVTLGVAVGVLVGVNVGVFVGFTTSSCPSTVVIPLFEAGGTSL